MKTPDLLRWLCGSLCSVMGTLSVAHAASPGVPDTLPSSNFDITSGWMHAEGARTPAPLQAAPASSNSTLTLSAKELVQRPALLQKALDSAVQRQDVKGVRFLLPLYASLPHRDEILVRFARAFVARAEGRYATAIDEYRHILAVRPELTPVRVQLAMTLFLDRQSEAARDQFRKAQGDAALPAPVQGLVEQYIQALDRQTQWNVSLGVRYLQDDNVNNAPQQRSLATASGVWTFPGPQAGHGLGYSASAVKDWELDAHLYARLLGTVEGKTYWDNHAYDDVQTRLYGGMLYRNGRHEVGVLPFFAYRWFGTAPYSHGPGLRVQETYALSPQWQLFGALEYGRLVYGSRSFLDGHTSMASVTLAYRPSARQMWTIGVDGGGQHARDASNAYHLADVRLGWDQEWEHGLSTSMQVSAIRRWYQGPDFFDILRRDSEYVARLSVWRRDWQWLGLTPRLTLQGDRLDSNHFYYRTRKNQAFIELSRSF